MVDSHETQYINPHLSAPLNVPLKNEEHFRLNKISEIKYCFVAEIKERELMNKIFRKFISSFDYFEKPLIVFSVTTGSISIPLVTTVVGAPVGITSASFNLTFSICTGIVKKLLKTTKNKKKKHNKTVMIGRSKLNSMESKTSEALINNKIMKTF